MNYDIFEITGKDTIDLLVYNAVKCQYCSKIIESKHRHDYKTCGCPNQTFIDGGLDYSRWGGKNLDFIESKCVYKTYTKEEYYELKRKQKERDKKAFDEVMKELLDD